MDLNMKHLYLIAIIIFNIAITYDLSYPLTADDYLNSRETNEYLFDLVNRNCVKKGILNCRKIAKFAIDSINDRESPSSRFIKIKYAWFYSFGYFYTIDNAIKLKLEKKFQVLPIEREEHNEAEKFCDLLIDKMELNNEDEKNKIILETRKIFFNSYKIQNDNDKRIKAIEDSLNRIRQRLKAKRLTKRDNNDIANTIPNDYSKYDKKLKSDKLDIYEYKIYKLLRDFMSIIYDID